MIRAPSLGRSLIGPGLFRLFLALIVFVDHASRLALGSAAVKVFFCLSGFWIYRIWTERYVRCRDPYITYVISRIWRVIPTFLLVVLITLIFLHYALGRPWAAMRGSANWTQFVASHLFILGYNSLPVQPLVPAWSLDVELQFYLVAPIMIMLAIRCGGLILLLCAAVMSLGFVYLIGSRGSPAFAVFFALGIAAAHTNWQPEPRSVTVSAMAAAAFVVGLAVSPWRGMLFGGANPDVLFHYTDVVNIAVALLVFPYAIFTTRQRGGIHDGFFADLSYIVYLLHWIAVCWLRRQAHLPMSARLGCFVFAVAATFTCSWAIRTFYDRPLNRTRARWVSARLRETALGLGHVSRRSPFTASCPLDTIPSRHKYFKRLKMPADSR